MRNGVFGARNGEVGAPRSVIVNFLLIACLIVALATHASAPPETTNRPTVIVVIGAAGEEQFGKDFTEAAAEWKKAAVLAKAACITIGAAPSAPTNDLALLRAALAAEPVDSPNELWITLLGHGTWDGKHARFNLRGPDLTAADLAEWLQPFRRPVALINTASSSAPFINALSTSNRVIVTATKSGAEDNYARFGRYISRAIGSPAADLDKDGQTSLLEAFLFASREVAQFYESEGRLATEHALLDDNGDALGTPADFFRGIRAVKTPSDAKQLDGLRAHQWHLIRSAADQQLSPEQRQNRDAIELKISALRQKKSQLAEEDYFRELERLLTDLGLLLR